MQKKCTEVMIRLCNEVKQEKDECYKLGYIEGVLDMYNEFNKGGKHNGKVARKT